MESRGLRVALRIWVVLALLFMFVPIALIFCTRSTSPALQRPISGFTVRWFSVASGTTPMSGAFLLSIKVGRGHRVARCSARWWPTRCTSSRSRPRDGLLLVLPLALPGIVTGIN
jgi:putative spermidine/putrescine transport system permease protein